MASEAGTGYRKKGSLSRRPRDQTVSMGKQLKLMWRDLRLLSGETAYGEVRLRQGPDVQFTALVLIKSVELCFHKLHVLLPGNFAVLVGVHEKQQLFDVVLPESQSILGLWDRRLLCGRMPKH